MRKYAYHVFTPFCRFQNLLYMAKRLHGVGVQWHVIFDADLPFTLQADWIHSMVCPTKEPGWFVGHWYQNYWVEHETIIDQDRYIMCSDDDDYEVGFFDLMDQKEGEVLICSMKRPGDILYADPGYMHCGMVGGEQIMMTGRVLRQFRWAHHYAGDWDFIINVITRYPPVFVPEARVWWNALDSGRPRDYPAA